MNCANCGYENLPEMRFCGRCGASLGITCHVCGFVNPREHRYCGKCGTRLSEEPAPVQPVAARTQPISVGEDSPETSPFGLTTVPLEGERRLATVILADVVGSTDILERIGTEAWVDTMNRVLQLLEGEVYRFGGVVDQFRGDGLVAFFGSELAREDDPERGVLASLAMHRVIEPYSLRLKAQDAIDLRLRVGVSTGEIIVASIGDDRHHSEDTAMGEAIALAARMEAAAQPGTVLVSDNTYHLVESRFEWEPLGQITVKGVSQPVRVYRPLTARGDAERVHRLQAHELLTPLVGREAEYGALMARIEKLRAGQGGSVLITGATGMGKSSLVAYAYQHTVRDDALLAKAGGLEPPLGVLTPRSFTWLHGRCRSYAQTSPYSMWQDVLGAWLDVQEDEPPTRTRDRLRRQSETLWGDLLNERYPDLAALLSLPLEADLARQMEDLDAQGRRQRLFVAVRSWIEELAKQRPLVMAFEDVHWADTSSLELLEYCLSTLESAPVLWLIVFRQDPTLPVWEFRRRVETEYAPDATSLTLSPLTDAQGDELIGRLVGTDVLPAQTRTLILDRAEGNPYYIEEFIHALVREDVLAQDPETGLWRATRTVDSLDVPDSLQNLLMAHIDRLGPDERQVLQLAAVIGPVFWSNVLKALVSDDGSLESSALKASLLELQRAQLIHELRQVPHLGVEYVFESNLVRDAAYERLLSVQRVSCHRKVADALEQIFGEKLLARYYSLLAYHFAQAGATRKELFYTLLAADEAREIYANAEALEFYTRALQLLDEIESETSEQSQLYAIRTRRFEVLNGRREVHYLMGSFEESIADAEALLPLAQQLEDDPVWMIDALLKQPGVGFFRSKQEAIAGVSLAENALHLAQQLGDRRREVQSLSSLAAQRYYLNDPSWQELIERALELARELGDKRYEAGILIGIGSGYASSDPQRSTEYLEAALPIVEALDDKMVELELLEVIGAQLESSSDYYRRLKDCHEKELQISREIGHRPLQGRALMFCGQIQALYLGDYETGMQLLEEAILAWRGIPGELFPLLRIAQVQVQQTEFEKAEKSLKRARQIGEKYVDDLARAGLYLVSAILYNAWGGEPHLRKALESAEKAFQMSTENVRLSEPFQMAAKCEAVASHLGLAQVQSDEAQRQEHVRQALKASQLAFDFYASCECVRPIECVSEEILYRHSLALRANGHAAQADDFLRLAHDEMMRKHDLIPNDSHFRRTFLENIPLHREIRSAVA